MKFSFGSIFFILYGLSSLIAGILNKDILFWSIRPMGMKRWLGKEEWRDLNIIFGAISVFLGIFILIFRK
jgi:hypothetical protein